MTGPLWSAEINAETICLLALRLLADGALVGIAITSGKSPIGAGAAGMWVAQNDGPSVKLAPLCLGRCRAHCQGSPFHHTPLSN